MIRTRHTQAVLAFSLLLAAVLCCTGCRQRGTGPTTQKMPAKDINAVLAEHDDELLKIPGVVGVYVGLARDGKTPCLKVMVERKTPELEKKIPKSLEGYRVEIDETGPIRPMKK